MFFFEEMALDGARKVGVPVPDVWFRYVDDVVARFRSDEDGVLRFLTFVNDLRQSIRFTVEFERRKVLSYLDVSINRGAEKVTFAVFRKPTHTNRYLDRASCHPRCVFRGVVRSLALRARRVCSRVNLDKELAGVEKILKKNGYK